MAISTKIEMKDFTLGTLKVTGQSVSTKANQATWIVECSRCHFSFVVPGWKLRSRKIPGCKNCGKHPNFKGCGDIYLNYWTKLRVNAEDRGLAFTITIQEAWAIYLRQDKKCALSGLPIVFERSKGCRAEKTASLDRIDSAKGYVLGNVQWVHKVINKMKGKLSDQEFISFCCAVAQFRKEEQK